MVVVVVGCKVVTFVAEFFIFYFLKGFFAMGFDFGMGGYLVLIVMVWFFSGGGWWWQIFFFWGVILVVTNWGLCLSFGGKVVVWVFERERERERERDDGVVYIILMYCI